MQFEYAHVKKYINEDNNNSRGKLIMQKCDEKSKEDRKKCFKEHKNEKTQMKENIGAQQQNEICEKSMSEVIKYLDIKRNSEEYMRNNHGEHWKHVDVNARNSFHRRA